MTGTEVFELDEFSVIFDEFMIEGDRDAFPSSPKHILLQEKEPMPWFKELSYYFSIDDLTARMTASKHTVLEVASTYWDDDCAFIRITPQEAMNILCKWGHYRMKEMKGNE